MDHNEEFDILLLAVGEAISNWSRVEIGLFEVFHVSIHSPALGPSAAAFMALDSFRAKLKMVDKTLQASRKYSPHITVWEKLRERCERTSLERNRLAHSQAIVLQVGKGRARAILAPYQYDLKFLTDAGRPDPRKIIRLHQVRQINGRFAKLGADLHTYSRKIA